MIEMGDNMISGFNHIQLRVGSSANGEYDVTDQLSVSEFILIINNRKPVILNLIAGTLNISTLANIIRDDIVEAILVQLAATSYVINIGDNRVFLTIQKQN